MTRDATRAQYKGCADVEASATQPAILQHASVTQPSIGTRIRAVRVKAGMLQGRFAGTLGYSRRALINWEQSGAEPPIGVLARLRDVYNVDPEWVVMGENLEPQSGYGQTDWDRYDRLEAMLNEALVTAGFALEPTPHRELVRSLFDDSCDADAGERQRLVRMLNALRDGVELLASSACGGGR